MANTAIRLGPLSTTGTGGGGPSTGFVKTFTIGAWISGPQDYEITIPESEHLRGVNPTVEVFELDGVYYDVFVSIEVSNAGEIKLKVSQSPDNRFAGKVIIS